MIALGFPFLFVILLLSVVGCQERPQPRPHNPRTVFDDLGNAVTLDRPAKRIVSMAPSITETLFALGLDSAVVGVTDYCDYPPQAGTKTRIGGIANPSLEHIATLRPDLILMSVAGNARGDYEKLRELGFGVFATNPTSVEGVFKSLLDLGALTETKELAEQLVARLRAERDSLVTVALSGPSRSVLLLLSLHPIVAVGPQTFLGELLRLANGRNVVEVTTTSYPILNREEILRRQPEVIIVTNDIASNVDQIINTYPEWKNLSAVRKKQIRLVDANLIARPGPRIVGGLRELVKAIHGISNAQ